ncbi:MAG: hypothetical protein ABFD16_31335 [Thermoguttaceae bacterium]|jgi:hypothetical protein
MSQPEKLNRRSFLNQSLAVAGAAGAGKLAMAGETAHGEEKKTAAAPAAAPLPYGMLGKAKISRVLLGGNLISGFMHARDLRYVGSLFRAYATDQKIIETLKVAEESGINTVFETGANYVARYNREYNGHMQFIPHIEVNLSQTDKALKDHIQRQVDTGAVALYVWGVSGDQMVKAGAVDRLAKAVELAKKHDIPVGVGSHSLLVPMACEKQQVPCDFYVKTLHSDAYPSATPKEKRKEFIWLDGGDGWYDNMWCIDPEETIEFMKTVTKPWIAFKVLAAGAFLPNQGFSYAFKNGADFIAVGMLDFQIKANCELAGKLIGRLDDRQRPWRA